MEPILHLSRSPRECGERDGFLIHSQDLTNVQCSIPNSHPMGIEHWELSIGQILPSCLCVLFGGPLHELQVHHRDRIDHRH
jgi:hypothetical protein